MMDSNVIECDLTRPWVDGGRDACGKYRVGNKNNFISVDFAMEVKRHSMNTLVGVKDTSRLIARLRYRQFGIVITTSYVGKQAYQEIKEDRHPVVIICGKDIVGILKNNGYGTKSQVKKWLERFPPKI